MAKSPEGGLRLPALGRRLLAAAVLVPLVVWIVLQGGWLFLGFNALWMLRLAWEFGAMRKARGRRHGGALFGAMVLALLAAFRWSGLSMGLALYVLMALALFGFEALRGRIEGATDRAGEKLLILFYLGLLPSHWALLRELPLEAGLPYIAGGHWFLFAAGVTWLGDTFAYFVGSVWGRHSLRSPVSPRKSVEGVLGGLGGAVLSAWVLAPYWARFLSPWQIVVVGLLLSAAGQLGDLFESLLKRDSAIKDSGSILPGHGGFLDRVDSMLFSIPVFYYLLHWAIL
ncbi:MAG: phosphatidate cytidylyltransferase [Candidatus Krumholzibacteriia bacterium]|nr:phosphatidate cytidylyltransferase [bacterium]MCB9512857.1 phosphatidate cytidylyltransferase [Candidatus Latescibacterota bacterium]MCB9516941.1 phosphatidate cytidylyltransferase [Candidatus Latescibacterota bacterium]